MWRTLHSLPLSRVALKGKLDTRHHGVRHNTCAASQREPHKLRTGTPKTETYSQLSGEAQKLLAGLDMTSLSRSFR